MLVISSPSRLIVRTSKSFTVLAVGEMTLMIPLCVLKVCIVSTLLFLFHNLSDFEVICAGTATKTQSREKTGAGFACVLYLITMRRANYS